MGDPATANHSSISPGTPHGATAIQIRGIVKSFPAPPTRDKPAGLTFAVDHVSLHIQPGELFFLLGPSGCGKTTLLRMIAGFIEPTEGTIHFEQAGVTRDVTRLAPNLRNTGMVFQSYALWPHMTVFDNVAFGLGVRKVPRDEQLRRVTEALAAVQMETYAPRKPNQLSGGQQQRVALARALVIRPSVLLLDEPLSNLDAKLRNDLRMEIRRICKASGITTVYVTHDQKEALSMADRIAIMRSGQLVQLATAPEMYRRPSSRFVAEFLGETNLLPATILSRDHATTTLQTSAGTLRSSVSPPHATGRVLLSLRPEALRLVDAPATPRDNTLPATILDTTFLGETAQHLVELKDGTRLRLAQLHPFGSPTPKHPAVSIHEDDVVILPAE
jgi:iron(III) transport system ATP-binding protein